MKLLGPARLALPDHLAVDDALDEAFAPLRARTANIGAARVRAAVRWSRPEPRPLRGVALLAPVCAFSVAVAVSAFLIGVSLAAVAPAVPDVSRDAVSADGWMLDGRRALQRPIDARATDHQTTAGDLATTAATVHREAGRTARSPEQASNNR